MSIQLNIATFFFLAAIVMSCDESPKGVSIQFDKVEVDSGMVNDFSKVLTKADSIVNESILAHGGDGYDHANYSFVFREGKYSFENNDDQFMYKVESVNDKGHQIVDVLDNNQLIRYIDGEEKDVFEKDVVKYKNALNSVVYFATLPHKLNDQAVNKSYKGCVFIEGENYDVIEVTFNQEGGGQDHDDEFCYWINSSTKMMDYMAYTYRVNGGGVRFRSAYNRRIVDGIAFQDYINFKADVGTPLANLPMLYEAGKLKELSKIITEKVINLNP